MAASVVCLCGPRSLPRPAILTTELLRHHACEGCEGAEQGDEGLPEACHEEGNEGCTDESSDDCYEGNEGCTDESYESTREEGTVGT